MRILAIDPGKTGAAVVLNDGQLEKFCIFDKGYTEFNNMLCGMASCLTVIEDVSGYRGENIKSIFTFGKQLGIVEGILLSNNKIVDQRVHPKTWQAIYSLFAVEGVGKKRWQDVCKRVNSTLPDKLYKHSGLADAYLIGNYICLLNKKKEL
jgi:hypothetical protein